MILIMELTSNCIYISYGYVSIHMSLYDCNLKQDQWLTLTLWQIVMRSALKADLSSFRVIGFIRHMGPV